MGLEVFPPCWAAKFGLASHFSFVLGKHHHTRAHWPGSTIPVPAQTLTPSTGDATDKIPQL